MKRGGAGGGGEVVGKLFPRNLMIFSLAYNWANFRAILRRQVSTIVVIFVEILVTLRSPQSCFTFTAIVRIKKGEEYTQGRVK